MAIVEVTIIPLGTGPPSVSERVNTIIRIDERRDKASSMDQKMKSIQEKLSHT